MFQTPSLPPRVKAGLKTTGTFLFTYAYKTPAALAHWFADKLETVATDKKITYGKLACITFPPSIMLRNGARAVKMVTKEPHLATIFGGLIGSGLAAAQGFALISGGGVLAGAGAAAVGLAAVVPGFIAGVFGIAVLFGATAMALSAVPAVMNIHVGVDRTRAALAGILPPLDLPPLPEAKPAPPPAPPPPEINAEEATVLSDNITFRKMKISFKNASSQQPEELEVKEFNPGDAIGSRKTITL